MNKQLLILSNDLLSEYLEKAPQGLNLAFEGRFFIEILVSSLRLKIAN
jgi:hypothetical protein